VKASDIIAQLRAVLPKLSDDFTDSVSITSLVRSGSTVTATTSSNHGLETGNYISITGAFEANVITSLTRDGSVVTGVTTDNHDLTAPGLGQPKIFDFNKAVVSGATESEYNGTHELTGVTNRKTFVYAVSGTPTTPATGSPVLLQDTGYNGRVEVTVTSKTTFAYEITTTPNSPAVGTMLAKKEARVSGAVSLTRAIRGYTEQAANSLWAFVVVGDVTVSKDRSIFNDATQTISKQDEWRQRLIEPFSVFIVIPATDSISARPARDKAEDVRPLLYQSLLGVGFPTTLTNQGWSLVTAAGDRFVGETSGNALYIHEFRFERVVDVTYEDTSLPDDNNAFRDFNFDATIEGTTGDLDADIDLDETPL
jgi:hypothetical protein